ncbi:MAG: aldose epimerase family protein [Lapillicoccus sp.]
MTVRTSLAGRLADGTPVYAHTLDTGQGGLALTVLELGATVDALVVPDRHGHRRDVVLAPPSIADRLASDAYLGSTVGRYANRIAGGTFVLDGDRYTVPINEGHNALHGGPDGFDRRVWRTVATDGSRVLLSLISPDGDQGFPGDLSVEVAFEVTLDSVSIGYRATTTAPTVVNLTNHTYFNLDGAGSDGIDDHLLTVDADAYTPVATDLIPTGETRAVAGTPFDLTRPVRLGDQIRRVDDQLRITHGLDHHLVVRGEGMRRHARLSSAESGLVLTVSSDQPGVQVYSGNFLDGSLRGRHGRTYRQGAGIALETQHVPDSPNQPGFPPTVLRPGETFTSTTTWELSQGDGPPSGRERA